MKKTKILTAIILLLTLCLCMSGCGKGLSVTFTLTGDSIHGDGEHANYENWIDNVKFNMPAGSSALDLITKALKNDGYSFEDESYISYITTPDGLKLGMDSNGESCGWIFAVNGEIASVGMADFELSDGDSVVLRFVDDFNTEVDWATNTFID